MIRQSIFLVCLVMLIPVSNVNGQTFDSLYGSGIHKYFSGCNAEAIQLFDAAIATNPQDPRPYYFRGLAKMNYGDQYGGLADFQQGAQMEAVGKRRSSMVSRSLERIQGHKRICIEQARQTALNPSLQTARGSFGSFPSNVVYGQPTNNIIVAPNVSAPSANPLQVINEVPVNPEQTTGVSQTPAPDVVADSTEIDPPADALSTPESTNTSLPPASPESSSAMPPANQTPAAESGLEAPAAQNSAIESRTLNPPNEPSDLGEAAQAVDSEPVNDPFGGEPAAESSASTPESAPVMDEPIEFPSEPTNDSPFDESPFDEPEETPAESAPTDENPVEGTSETGEGESEPQDSKENVPEEDSNEDGSSDEDDNVIDDPFGG